MIGDFAQLVDDLLLARSRNEKCARIGTFLREAGHKDRGWALAALTGSLALRHVTPAIVRKLASDRVDEALFRLSRDFVGDTAETVALIWPEAAPGREAASGISLDEIITTLRLTDKKDVPLRLASWLDRMTVSERFALLKLVLGHFRVGVSARLAKSAFADAFGVSLAQVEEYWHASPPPHDDLFDWAEGRAPPPDITAVARFRPFMLAHPAQAGTVDLSGFAAEWKWDGIRVQLVRVGNSMRLYSRGGEDITGAFPEFSGTLPDGVALDGELLICDEAAPFRTASFSSLQKRLGRKAPPRGLLQSAPAFVRVYDLLSLGGDDLRIRPWSQRREALEQLMTLLPEARYDLSALIEAPDEAGLDRLRQNPPAPSIEGVMLKRRDSAYVAGRIAGLWYKWKREPYTADCVLMYAQRGSGRRSSLYSDYTFGCWTPDGGLVPVGKAYSGFTDEELRRLDRFVRSRTVSRYGPVLEVARELVLEIAFDSLAESSRHKSGLAMRFPRISRIRWDKPACEADTVAGLRALAGLGEGMVS